MSLKAVAYALDPALWSAEVLGIEQPDPWQVDALRSPAKRSIWNIHRQAGKSTISAIKALHRNIYKPGSLVLMVSPSLRQSSELFRKWTGLYDLLPDPPAFKEETKLSVELETGSRCVSLPGNEATVRGFSAVDLVIEDEAARVGDDFHYMLKPMLAVSGGDIILMSTPFGKRGHFFHIFEESGPEWQKIRVPATECPRISSEFLEEERRSMPESWFKQEYLCEFVDSVDAVFTYDQIRAAITDEVEPLEFEVT